MGLRRSRSITPPKTREKKTRSSSVPRGVPTPPRILPHQERFPAPPTRSHLKQLIINILRFHDIYRMVYNQITRQISSVPCAKVYKDPGAKKYVVTLGTIHSKTEALFAPARNVALCVGEISRYGARVIVETPGESPMSPPDGAKLALFQKGSLGDFEGDIQTYINPRHGIPKENLVAGEQWTVGPALKRWLDAGAFTTNLNDPLVRDSVNLRTVEQFRRTCIAAQECALGIVISIGGAQHHTDNDGYVSVGSNLIRAGFVDVTEQFIPNIARYQNVVRPPRDPSPYPEQEEYDGFDPGADDDD